MTPYELLGVARDATPDQIRRAYRSKARMWHPDRNPDNTVEADRRFKQIGEAYRILSDPKERHLWDLRHSAADSELRTLWDRLRDEKDDPTSQALVMLYDLCHDQETDGFERYQEFIRQPGFDLAEVLKGRDFRDACFLLAEQFETRKRWQEAADLYHAVYWAERRKPLMDYYCDETRERLWELLSKKVPKIATPRATVKGLARAVSYARTPGQLRRQLKQLCHRAHALGFDDLAARAARGFVRHGGNAGSIKVSFSEEGARSGS